MKGDILSNKNSTVTQMGTRVMGLLCQLQVNYYTVKLFLV